MPSGDGYKIKTLVESCKSFYVANSPNDFDRLIPQVINILKNDAILSTCKDDILKCLEYYARCILKNREKLKDFTKRYHETCKYIIKLDFIKGYYILLVLTKCIIDSKTPATNVKYVDKFYYKFTFLLKNSNYDNKKSNQNRISAIKEAYTTFKKEINLVKPIKRGRNLAQEDMTADDIFLRKELKKYKVMIKEPKKHIPKFLYYLPDDVNMKILSSLNKNDFLELRCSNSLVNRFVSNTYLPKMEIFYKNILIDNDASFQKFYSMISVFKARTIPIEKLVFDFDTLKPALSLTIDLKTIQQMINLVRVKELCIINHSWTLISIFPLNLIGKGGHKIERLTIKIGKIINENYRFLENSFLLFTTASLTSLSIDYINMVYIKETARIGIKSSSQAIQCYDGSVLRRQETTNVESLEVISFLDMAMFPLLNKYTKNKVFMEIFIKFDEIFTNLKEITLKNFSIYNMNSLFGYIRANPLKITKLELLRIPSLPQLPKLFLLLKDLNNLKTFSLHSSSNLRYSFTSMNSFILIKDVYDTSQVSDVFLERFFIIPLWPKLEELTLIETSINKPILENLLNQNMKFLCLNDNLNLKYMPAERVAEFNPNVDISKFFITDMKKFHELMPNLEVFSLNNLDFDAHCSYITGITNSFFKDLFDMNLKTLDVSMNQLFAMRIYDFLTYINMQANEDGLSVGNLIYDDFFGQDKKSKDGFEEKMKMLNLVKGLVSNKLKQFKDDNEYVCWYRTCVLDKYKCI